MDSSDLPSIIYGVDFSAAAKDSGRNTWIAECKPSEDGIVVERLADAVEFLECSPRRDSTLPALVDLIGKDLPERRAFGLDFPFGLPRDLQGGNWHEFISGIRDRDEWGELGVIDDPQSLYGEARARAEDANFGLRRETDRNRGGQEPTGYRIKTQTYYGISRVLANVADDASVVPVDEPTGNTVVLETYPRAVFASIDAVQEGYKHNTRRSIENRRKNVEALSAEGVELGEHATFAVASDDALDAVAAAWATWGATCADGRLVDVPELGQIEGYIYC